MKLLVCILTSSNAPLARLTYNSIINQKEHGLDYTVTLVVNSKNSCYFNDIKSAFSDEQDVALIETESNGKPGKGHNSVLHYFKTQPDYDYCIVIDGDDFFYPSAFNRLKLYLGYNPDMLFVNYHDNISVEKPEAGMPFFCIQDRCYWIYNLDHVTKELWYTQKGVYPFNKDINELNTIARPLVFSRKAVDYDVSYDENMCLYDDFNVFLKSFEHYLSGNLKVYGLIDSDIFLYNRLYVDSATVTYSGNQNKKELENIYYQKSIRKKFLLLKNWDLKKLPLLQLEQFDDNNFIDKFLFVNEIIKKFKGRFPPLHAEQRNNLPLILQFAKEKNLSNLYRLLTENLAVFTTSGN